MLSGMFASRAWPFSQLAAPSGQLVWERYNQYMAWSEFELTCGSGACCCVRWALRSVGAKLQSTAAQVGEGGSGAGIHICCNIIHNILRALSRPPERLCSVESRRYGPIAGENGFSAPCDRRRARLTSVLADRAE